ncbi:cupin domain-containing protein [Arthrobacter sp. SX1312]|uniref:cupin domain-containing protein n=1 Tax=Arthrobacter sp. SX1312 TaxID=2058896 RepID=UPI000CE2EE01
MRNRADECTIVTDGRVGFLLDDEVYYAGPGELVVKPRDQWHTFRNAGDGQERTLSRWTSNPCRNRSSASARPLPWAWALLRL